jgi:hypothetical protein
MRNLKGALAAGTANIEAKPTHACNRYRYAERAADIETNQTKAKKAKLIGFAAAGPARAFPVRRESCRILSVLLAFSRSVQAQAPLVQALPPSV